MFESARCTNQPTGTPAKYYSDWCNATAGLPSHSVRQCIEVNLCSLSSYYHYLAAKLSFPFRAWYPEPTLLDEVDEYPCIVLGLIDPQSGIGDEIDGIYCTVRNGEYERNLPLIELELPQQDPNFNLVEQYWDWFWNCGVGA